MSIYASNERINVNALERVIIDQHARIVAAGEDPITELEEAQGEILAAATPELVVEIMNNDIRPETETKSVNGQCRAFQDSSSITSRSLRAIQTGNNLARIGMLRENQGYTGGLILNGDDVLIYANSMSYRGIKENDPIQDAMEDVFYPPMVWAKALRAEAYRRRSDAAQELSMAEYLSKLGMSLGCALTEFGDIVGATGFMPGERLQGVWGCEMVQQHIMDEQIEAYRLSGLCDQAVVEPLILTETPDFAKKIVQLGGSLN